MISEERLQQLYFVAGATPTMFARAVEAEAYEAAAKVCEANLKATPHHCAAAIRRLRAAYCDELGVAISPTKDA